MPHYTPLIGPIVAGLVIAFALGALAHRLKVSPIAGYLLAGMAIGQFLRGKLSPPIFRQCFMVSLFLLGIHMIASEVLAR